VAISVLLSQIGNTQQHLNFDHLNFDTSATTSELPPLSYGMGSSGRETAGAVAGKSQADGGTRAELTQRAGTGGGPN